MRSTLVSSCLLPILLLLGSNLFMTLAWYGHLRFKEVPLVGVIVASCKEPLTWNYAIGFALIAAGGVLRPARPAVTRFQRGCPRRL